MASALLRSLLIAAAMVTAYYLLPYDHLSDAASILVLCLGLVGVVLLVLWEIRAILRAEYPAIQGIEALASTIPLFLLLFSTAYYLMERSSGANFSQSLTRTDALYFTVTTFATVGYGDITARTQSARVVVIFQMLADLVLIGAGVRVLLGAVQMGRQRRTGAGDGPPDAASSSPPVPASLGDADQAAGGRPPGGVGDRSP